MHHNINYTKNIDHGIFMHEIERKQSKQTRSQTSYIYMEKVKAIEMKILERERIIPQKRKRKETKRKCEKGQRRMQQKAPKFILAEKKTPTIEMRKNL